MTHATTGARARVLAALALTTIASQFFRASTAAIAPDLIADLGLSAQQFGAANGVFFLAIGIVQIPVGILFDRYGPRRITTALTGLAMVGAVWQALCTSGAEFLAARFLLGVGCAGSFMSAVLLCSRWFAGDRLAMVLSWVFALSQTGLMLATTPLAAASAAWGWRTAYLAAAAGALVIGAAFFLLVRDAPPGSAPPATGGETIGDALRGVAQVWRTKGLLPVLAIHTVAYASMATVLSVWAGKYLSDVHGLDAVARGNVLLAMTAFQVAGTLAYGPLDRLLNTRKWVIVAGALLSLCTLGPLALIAGTGFWPAAALLCLHCAVTAYGIVIVAHGRTLFPAHLAGRGVTTVNIAQVVGSAALPWLTGIVIGLFPAATTGGYAESAYRAAFGVIVLAVLAGLAVYLTARDARPRG
ncbi:MFS transporter [Vineibacter terrae]|uniref:MFS transporter n=1 Tax=Vineibacter terrae TaxID=2586908 RepID=UPI002E34A08B|nr:MFS transporter [Vineibacter terrae]HEX2886731.1 MFS transporter [Vineibacter terrae]